MGTKPAVQALSLVSSPLTASSTVQYANTLQQKISCLTTEWLPWLQASGGDCGYAKFILEIIP